MSWVASGHKASWRWALIAVGAVSVLAVLGWNLSRFWPYPNDDAFITFRYSRALAEGRGPYFNPGERVEGYSNPLLMLLVSGWIRVAGPGGGPLFARMIGIASATACCALAALLCVSAFPEPATRRRALAGGITAAGLVAASPYFAVNSISGLETTLYAALLSAGVSLSARRRERWSAAMFALATLTRPDAAAMFGVHWLARLIVETAAGRLRHRIRALLESLIAVTAFVGLHLLLRHALYDGEWLPNTYYAKRGGFGLADYWLEVCDGAFVPVFGLAGVTLGAAGLALNRRAAEMLLPALVTGLAAAHLTMLTGPDWMIGARLVIPSLPLLAAACAGGWVALLTLAPLPSWVVLMAAAIFPASAWMQRPLAADLVHRLEAIRNEARECHAEVSRWLSAHSRRGDALAITDIGLIGFENPGLTVIDISGLTDRDIGKSPGRFLDKRYDPALVFNRRPRWVVFSGTCDPVLSLASSTGTETRLAASPAFSSNYRFVRAFGPPAGRCDRRFYLYERGGALP